MCVCVCVCVCTHTFENGGSLRELSLSQPVKPLYLDIWNWSRDAIIEQRGTYLGITRATTIEDYC